MSYDIYFIKRKDLNEENIDEVLEEEVSSSDQHFVTKQEMLSYTNALAQQGLQFEQSERADDDCVELNFPTYQVSMYNSQLVISVPYWDSNNNDTITKEVKTIINTFLDKGFTGYDPQTAAFVVSKYDFKQSFSETKRAVDTSLQQHTAKNNLYKYIVVGIALLIIVLLVWFFLR